jgi:hypothetical protein
MHDCPNQKTIDQIEKLVIKGNGEPSLMTAITRMSTKLDSYMQRQEDLIKEYKVFSAEYYDFRDKVNEFQTTVTATDAEKEKQEVKSRWKVGIMITVLMATMGILSAWIKSDMKNLEKRQDWTSSDLMYLQDSLKYRVRGIDTLNYD